MGIVLFSKYSDNITDIHNHYHDCHELIYIKKGTVTLKVSSKCYSACGGTMIIINRFEEHSIEIKSEEYHRFDMRIAPTFDTVNDSDLSYLYPFVVDRPDNFSHIIKIEKNKDELESTFLHICEEYNSSDLYGENMLNLLFKQLLIYVLRNNKNEFSKYESKYLDLINNIKRTFETEYEKEYTLESLSEIHHISPYYLSHIFKSVTGCSIMKYLNSCRIAQAKNLLIKTDMPIYEIVAKCGFSDSSNFVRLFKKNVGISAREFRKIYK